MSKKTNTFSRALRHLKSDQRDALTEQPTNNTQGLMTKEPSEYIDPVPDGTTWYKDEPLDLDFDKDEDADDGQNTSGIFESDGTILTIEPPGDTSYVLGPMSAMWYAWGNFTRIGYIRQEDRRMVNLASLTGELGAWDGTADAFSSYGQLTLAQADWFRTTPKKDGAGNDTPNYRAFYAGPPSNTPDEFGRYLCVITGTAKEVETAQTADTPGYTTKPVEGPEDPTTMFSALMNRLNKAGKFGLDAVDALPPGLPSLLAKSTWGIADNLFYGNSNYMLKGVPQGFKFTPNFIGAGNLFGLKTPKLADMADNVINAIPKLVSGGKYKPNLVQKFLGKNYAGQWFTDPRSYKVAGPYAGPKGTISILPAPQQGIFGWKNWLSSKTSRSLARQPEKFVRKSTQEAILKYMNPKQLRRIDMPNNARTQKLLSRYAAKIAKNTVILSKGARALPVLGAVISGADAINRLRQGDTTGAALSVLSMVPGPFGWFALGAQAVHDYGPGGRHKLPFTEESEGQNNDKEIGDLLEAMIEEGVPLNDPDELAQEVQLLGLSEGMNPELVQILVMAITGSLDTLTDEQQKDVTSILEESAVMFSAQEEYIKQNGKKNVKESLGEERIWIREIRKPVKVPELQKKFKGIKPRVKKKGEDYRVIGGGLMKNEAVPAEFNPTRENRMWRKYEYNQNVRASQEKKNQVLELIGEGDHQWNYMLGNERWRTASQMKKFYGDHDYLYDYYYGGKKHRVIRKEGIEKDFLLFIEDENGVKDTIRQSELNDLLAEERDKEDFKEYYMHETQQKEREKNFDRATRLKTIIGKIKRGDIKPEHPEEEPPKMINGWHPKLGKHYKYDKLDPISAQSMPPTGDPEIDANVEKAKRRPK